MLRGILDEDSLKLYTLIWCRTVACQMEPATFKQVGILFFLTIIRTSNLTSGHSILSATEAAAHILIRVIENCINSCALNTFFFVLTLVKLLCVKVQNSVG